VLLPFDSNSSPAKSPVQFSDRTHLYRTTILTPASTGISSGSYLQGMNLNNRLTTENFISEFAARLIEGRRSADCRVASSRCTAESDLAAIRRQAIEGYRLEDIGWFILAGSAVVAFALSF
jgi:hypothetical protein